MLKLAIVRVNETTCEQEILLEAPLSEHLAEELGARHVPGFRKRNVRKALEALKAAEIRLRHDTIRLP